VNTDLIKKGRTYLMPLPFNPDSNALSIFFFC